MSHNKAEPDTSNPHYRDAHRYHPKGNDPLSGSKKVKNRNHSGKNQGDPSEGS